MSANSDRSDEYANATLGLSGIDGSNRNIEFDLVYRKLRRDIVWGQSAGFSFAGGCASSWVDLAALLADIFLGGFYASDDLFEGFGDEFFEIHGTPCLAV